MENSMSRLLNELSVLTLNRSMQFKQARMLMFKQISQWGLLGKYLKITIMICSKLGIFLIFHES